MTAQRHNARECWCGINHGFGPGLPPAGGWKRDMTEKPTYDHKWAGERINERNRYARALWDIAEKAKWYANNSQRDPQEVDHALCVEILALAEDALNG